MDNYFPFVQEVTLVLFRKFGRGNLGNKPDPLDELFYILLSSKTPPTRYQQVYSEFKFRYPDSNKLALISWRKIATVIKNAGLQNRKAKAVAKISRILRKNFGRVSLDPLFSMTEREIEKFLVKLPEINVKSARCVMLYSLGIKVFPVDSHCFRVSQRLGWIDSNASLSKAIANQIQDQIPKNLRKRLHVGMIILGRKYCTPSDPNCLQCPLLKFCPTGKNKLDSEH